MPFGRLCIYLNGRYFFEKRNDAERDNYKMECGPEKIVFPGMTGNASIGAE
jgi:hypothetical protein